MTSPSRNALRSVPFNMRCLQSPRLELLFKEVSSYAEEVRVEEIIYRSDSPSREMHPAATVGLPFRRPTIQIADSLSREERIEAIAHECLHLLLVYRHGLGVVGRRIPRPGNSEDVFHYYMAMNGDWAYLLGQVANTAHHLILGDYLKKEYGVESHLHRRLLHHNFRILLGEKNRDKESAYAKGVIAYEYERLIGSINGMMSPSCATEAFERAYLAAKRNFGTHSFQSVPTPSAYETNILSFLEELGYDAGGFLFFPSITDEPFPARKDIGDHPIR